MAVRETTTTRPAISGNRLAQARIRVAVPSAAPLRKLRSGVLQNEPAASAEFGAHTTGTSTHKSSGMVGRASGCCREKAGAIPCACPCAPRAPASARAHSPPPGGSLYPAACRAQPPPGPWPLSPTTGLHCRASAPGYGPSPVLHAAHLSRGPNRSSGVQNNPRKHEHPH